MKRLSCILLALLLLVGCRQRTISPRPESKGDYIAHEMPTAAPTIQPPQASPTPAAMEPPRPALATFAPVFDTEPLFAEEVLSQDGEPLFSQIRALLSDKDLSKQDFHNRLSAIIAQAEEMDQTLRLLFERGRTLTEERKESTIDVLTELVSESMLADLEDAYSKCAGEGEALPIEAYRESIDALLQDLVSMEPRTVSFFTLSRNGAREYMTVLSRYMGEPVDLDTIWNALDELCQTEAYALSASIKADPEVVRRKEPISLGSFDRNLSLLRRITQDLCSLPDGSMLPVAYVTEQEKEMDLLQLAFRYYPGMTFLKAYGAQAPEDQQARWASAPDGYLAGLAVHGSYAVISYLDDFELEYVQYRWYEEMLYKTLTGISALLIHYYGYSIEDLAEYLKSWGAESFTKYLYDAAMFDPFECVIASYGYYQYLDICQAALDAGCENERRFLQDYLAAGPGPFRELKEYMVALYQKQG